MLPCHAELLHLQLIPQRYAIQLTQPQLFEAA
jgi:hypothetical protein